MLTIDPMQDALNPDGYPLIEADAKLLFLKGGHYCFQYRDAGKETYKFLSPETVRAAFQHEQIDSGWIPSGVQRLGICKQGQWFVQFIPPARRTFTFTNLTEDGEPIALTIGDRYRIRVKTCKIGLKALLRGALRNQFRLIGRTTKRTESMLKRSNGLLAMRTTIAKFASTEKAKLSSDIHPERISRITRSPARRTELKHRNRLNGSTTRDSLKIFHRNLESRSQTSFTMRTQLSRQTTLNFTQTLQMNRCHRRQLPLIQTEGKSDTFNIGSQGFTRVR